MGLLILTDTLPEAGLSEDAANTIIMAARAHWFVDEPVAEADPGDAGAADAAAAAVSEEGAT